MYQFTQEDVDAGRIAFRHQGNAYGRMALWVTDGQFHTTGVLEVQASEPFLERVNASTLAVRRGAANGTVVGVEQIGLATNVDAPLDQVRRLILSSFYRVSRTFTGFRAPGRSSNFGSRAEFFFSDHRWS